MKTKLHKNVYISIIISSIILLVGCSQENNTENVPVAVWTFDKNGDDTTGMVKGELVGNAKIANGKLILDGVDSYLKTGPMPFSLSEKTIVVRCVNKNKDQRNAGVVAVTGFNGVPNDTIGYSIEDQKTWGPGSEWAFRSARIKGEEENAKDGEIVEVVATYEKDGEIAFYRNGKPYGTRYNNDSPTQDYRPNRYMLLIGSGIDHRIQKASGSFNGEIDEVIIYDKALKPDEVEKSYLKKQSSANPLLVKGERTESVKSDMVSLNGSVFCGYEYDGSSDYWSMAIKPNTNNKELFEVVWTKPLSTAAPPYDFNYRVAEKLVLTSNDGKKVKFLRVNYNDQYEANIDSNGNLVDGTVFNIERQAYVKKVWSLLKVK
jgi:hypothetical protein